jgi:MucR family transcriptional regulator, transcriptional regulator of exopolysaccharide biosynthesis
MATAGGDENTADEKTRAELLEMAARMTSAYVAHNRVDVASLNTVLMQIHAELRGLQGVAPEPTGKPAVAIKKSISTEYIVCLEDGKRLRTLKRYLRSHYNMSPEEYRAKWGLPFDYPMVAPAYAKLRSEFAKKLGLGRKPRGGPGGATPRRRK